MLNEKEMHRTVLKKLAEIKGYEYVMKNKNNLYPCWNIKSNIAQISILLSDGFDDSIFGNKGDIEIDETKKAKEEFKFEVNLNSGECNYIN